MLFKLSILNSNRALTLGYLNPALNNSALLCGPNDGPMTLSAFTLPFHYKFYYHSSV